VHRNARAHQHVADAGQHCAVDGRQVRHLDFFQKVDADGILVVFTRQIDLDKVAHDAQLDHFAQVAALMHGHERIGHSDGLAASDVVLVPDALGHLWKGEGIQAAAHVSAGVAIGESADKERIKRRAGDDAELTEFGDRVGQAPVGDAHTHATLNDLGKLHHE